jgi:hypothetical protein
MNFPAAIAGAWLIGNVADIYNSRYLFNNLLLLSLPLIALSTAALLDAGILFVERMTATRMAALPAVAILLVMMSWLAMDFGRAAPSLTTTRINAAIDAMCRRAVPETTCIAKAPQAFQRAPIEFVEALERGTGPLVVTSLKQSPQVDAFFAPPENEAYWRFVTGGHRPFENLNFLPAHFGKPMLLGLPPPAHGVDVGSINTALLGRYDEGARSRSLGDSELCRHAQRRHIHRVLVFESLEPPNAMRVLDCRTRQTSIGHPTP